VNSGADPAQPAGQAVARTSARVIVAGPGDVILLMRFGQDAGGAGGAFWLTPGGGVRAGESLAVAAIRELAEEAGIAAVPDALGPVVAESSGRWSDGRTVYDAHDSYFFLRVAGLEVDTDGQEDLERSLVTGHRWWRPADLAASGETVYPPGLPALAGRLLAGDMPRAPVLLPWR